MNSSRSVLNSAAAHRSFLATAVRRSSFYPALRYPRGSLATRAYSPHLRRSVIYTLPRRYFSTETSTSSGGPAGPPPGFNVEEAKKPIPVDNATKETDSSLASKTAAAENNAAQHPDSVVAEAEKAKSIVVERKAALEKKKEEAKKLGVWQKVKHGVQHFWDGTKLLGVELKISWNLALKMAAGYELSRRERRQLERTVKDLGRLVPFSVFIIVPAGELFLPIALKIFPNLLPSTYEDQKAKDMKSKKLRSTRKDVSNFLRTTMKESGIPVSAKTRQREEFTQFFKKIRTSGESPTREELIKVCKTFKDDVTLDNLSRPQLVGMCRYMNLNSFGTDAMLRYNIRHRMRQIKRDDRAISFEGVDSLTIPELQMACASRGIRTHGVSPGHLRDDLNTWLELRLKHGLPSTLLVMANAFMYAQGKESEMDSQFDALQAVLSSIPEELYHEIELEVSTAEGAATNKQRLEVLREQQELIEEENEQSKDSKEAESVPQDNEDIDEDQKKKDAEAEEADAAKEESKDKRDR